MKNWILILCLLTAPPSPRDLPELIDGWGTKYNLTHFGKFAAKWPTGKFNEDSVIIDGLWFEVDGQWWNGPPVGEKTVVTTEKFDLEDGLWVSKSTDVDTQSDVHSATYKVLVTRQKTSTAKPAPPKDPNAIILKAKETVLSDRDKYGPWEKWKGFFE